MALEVTLTLTLHPSSLSASRPTGHGHLVEIEGVERTCRRRHDDDLADVLDRKRHGNDRAKGVAG